MEIFGILLFFQIVKFWKFAIFRNWKISEILLFYEFRDDGNLPIFEIVKFWKFSEFSILEIFRFFQIGHFWISSNWIINEYRKFSNLKDQKISRIFFQFRKPKFGSQNRQILELFVYSIFRTTRNFVNSHIIPLI